MRTQSYPDGNSIASVSDYARDLQRRIDEECSRNSILHEKIEMAMGMLRETRKICFPR